MGRAHENRITVDVLFGMQKNQKRCISPKELAILLLEKKIDNIKELISDNKFLHI